MFDLDLESCRILPGVWKEEQPRAEAQHWQRYRKGSMSGEQKFTVGVGGHENWA